MRVIITGGFGFIGMRLAQEILRRDTFRGAPLDELVLVDRFVPAGSAIGEHRKVTVVESDVAGAATMLFERPCDAVFHLAAAVSSECEADYDLGMRVNVDATRALLDAARAAGGKPLVVLASSLAVYGGDDWLPLPSIVSESTLACPQTSYGAQKLMCEQLVADNTRKGFIDGRVARLMTVAIRPGRPNAAASGFVSGIVREPLAGIPADCPVDPRMSIAIASPAATVRGLLAVAEAQRGTAPGLLVGRGPVNLPALTITVAELLEALRAVGGDAAADLVTVVPDQRIEAIVGSWPAHFDGSRAAALGLEPDRSAEAVIRQYVSDLTP